MGVPVPTSPGDGASLVQPDNPPLLRWEGAQGATSYTVQLDGDADFIGAKTYTTKITSLVVPDPLIVGTYYWRVIATKATGIVSQPSATSSFSVKPLAAPTQTYPPNSVDFKVQEVVLDWAPVTGAKSYDVQVATGPGVHQHNRQRDRHHGHALLARGQPGQQPVLVAGACHRPARPGHPVDHFAERLPAELPRDSRLPLYPLGTAGSPATVASDDPYLSWTPVKRAASTRSTWPTTRTSRPTSAPARRP